MEQFKFIGLTAKATKDSLTIEWDIETDIPENGFSQWAYLFIGDDPVGNPIELPVKSRSYTFRNLKAGTEYAVYVQAYLEPDHKPLPEECIVVNTETKDTTPPKVSSTALEVSNLTSHSFTVSWEKAEDNITPKERILYEVFLLEAKEKDTAKWKLIAKERGIGSAQVNDLEPGAEYKVRVLATDEANMTLSYPGPGKHLIVETYPLVDLEAPTVKNKALTVTHKDKDRITIRWEPASDNVTSADKILYEVGLTEFDNLDTPWRIVKEENISSYTFAGLKPNTNYHVYVKAFDKSGNICRYSVDNETNIVRTEAYPAKKLDYKIEQEASVRQNYRNDSGTISLVMEYNYIQMDEKGKTIGQGSGSRELKWADQETKEGAIKLPQGCCFENNQVLLRIRSRKTDLSGKNQWIPCCSGHVDVSGEYLKIRLIGDYYTNSVTLGGRAKDGYAQFIEDDAYCPAASQEPINRINVEIIQGADLLPGISGIRVLIKYTSYEPIANLTNEGEWAQEWTNKAPVTSSIQLPSGWYFKDNRVKVTLQRKALALTRWENGDTGLIDISKKSIKLKLTGNYLQGTLFLTGASDGFDQFIK